MDGLAASESQEFDGVVCFGGVDWWYHNRGHYDLQMMNQLRRHVPVVYVNSIGVRAPRPSEGRMFVRRMIRKSKSLMRGLVLQRDNFFVLSLFLPPTQRGAALFRAVARLQLRRACHRAGIKKPLIWVTCPTATDLLETFPERPVVYERTDRWEEFPDCDRAAIERHHARLRSLAVLTLYASRSLHGAESAAARRAIVLNHGVDFERFASAGETPFPEPDDLAAVPRPRVGFVGSIDSHTFDERLFRDVVAKLPEVSFVLVGPSSIGVERWGISNVRFLGQKDYESVAQYMAGCDVLIMPWNDNEWIRACNPVKLKEYLAVGRPVVSSPFPELDPYSDVVAEARGPDQFADRIRLALAAPPDATRLRARVREETWDAKGRELLAALERAGVALAGRR